MSTATRLTMLLAVAALGVACHDQRSMTSPHRISADFSDGRTGSGNPHFFLLPPIVGQPTFTGTFNTNLAPVVDICQLTVDALGNPIACDAGVPEINPGVVQADRSTEHYGVNWDTGQPQVDLTKFYRIQVRGGAGLPVLGFADMQPVRNGGQLKDVNTGQYIGLVDGRTLPIKFRIEQGALCFNFSTPLSNCVEGTVGPGGGDVVAPNFLAAAHFPTGYFSQNTTVIITPVATECFTASTPPPSGFDAFGCYLISTSPKVGDPLGCTAQPGDYPVTATDAATCARVEVCPSLLASDANIHHLRLLKSDPLVPATALKEATATLITSCEVFPIGVGVRGHRTVDFAMGTWQGAMRALGQLVMPTPLFGATAMSHLGVGGLTCCLSNIGFGPLALTAVPELTSLTIGSSSAELSYTIVSSNPFVGETEGTISGISLQAFIVQGTISVAAGTAMASCTGNPGDVPGLSTCVSSNLTFTVPQGQGFVPNPATAHFELHQGATLLDVINVSVNLLAPLQ